MSDFISVCRVQMIPVTHAPHIATADAGGVRQGFTHDSICLVRINPYLPSFSRMAARIIDPATGASTCALGSHK